MKNILLALIISYSTICFGLQKGHRLNFISENINDISEFCGRSLPNKRGFKVNLDTHKINKKQNLQIKCR